MIEKHRPEVDPKEIEESLSNVDNVMDLEEKIRTREEEDDSSLSKELKQLAEMSPKATALERRQGYRLALLKGLYDFRKISSSLVYRPRGGGEGYRVLSEDGFAALAYESAPEAMPNDVRSLYQKLRVMSPDFTSLSTIRLGDSVWDTRTATLHALDLTPDSPSPYAPQNVLWYSPYTPTKTSKPVEDYLLSLANNNPAVVEDIVSSIAVTFLDKKPRGLFWWVGSGKNGKSVLMELIQEYIFPDQVSNVGMAQLESGRGVGDFNQSLLNISTEAMSSHGVVEDATNYKFLGAHEPFRVKQLWNDSYLQIRGGVNSIYAVNSFPDFREKNEAITSRTKIIEFANQFEDQANFKNDTFTPEFVASFIARVLDKAREIYEAGGLLTFSDSTTAFMLDYASESNPTKAFLEQAPFVGFKHMRFVYELYTQWHQDQNLTVGMATMRELSNSLSSSHFRRRSVAGYPSVRPFVKVDVTSDELHVFMASGSEVFYRDAHQEKSREQKQKTLVQELEGWGDEEEDADARKVW